MKYLLWLLKAAIFFTLFAFALNNQQDATVHFFFGTQWRAPLVLVVLSAFAVGVAVGVLGMVPRWWRMHRSAARRMRHLQPHADTGLPRQLLLRQRTAPPSMEFDTGWILLGLAPGLRAGLAGLAVRSAPAAR